ncbi:unnamed protein product [Parnassius apollo]|uniref:(apollo) hypothetical protein n=1 Tax=Parnassius apollo TaxID=110799 RepID=A0A8S3W924_PARAO|nr:unnamed protein product [Parnassius apollo]
MCVLSDCTHIWKGLLSSNWLLEEANKLKARYNAAMTPAHLAAHILDPKYRGEGLDEEEDTMGMEFIDLSYPQAIKDVLTYRAMSFPFKDYMFKEDLLKRTYVSVWWRSLGSKIDPGMINLTNQVYTATASCARIERLFSTFGLVHSKLRNRLGTKKAAKLVTVMRALNPGSRGSSYVDEDEVEELTVLSLSLINISTYSINNKQNIMNMIDLIGSRSTYPICLCQ